MPQSCEQDGTTVRVSMSDSSLQEIAPACGCLPPDLTLFFWEGRGGVV